MTIDVAEGPGWTLYCGAWQDTPLADARVDALIADPPYSARTHEGQTQGGDRVERRDLSYAAWDDGDVWSFVTSWSPRVAGWAVALTDSELLTPWSRAADGAGRYAFAPVPCCISGMTVRLTGDGPSSWAVYAMVSRPRSAEWLADRKAKRDARGEIKSLPGFYAGPREEQEHIGGKPLWLMRALVRDYSEPGDLVCDPTAGGATTLLASVIEGRRAIGAERDPETWRKAVARLRRGYTPSFDWGAP